MAWWYMASVRCKNEWVAAHLKSKYSGQTFVFNLPDNAIGAGREVGRMYAESSKDEEGGSWVDIGCHQITDSGLSSDGEKSKADQFDNVIYGMLRNDPHFDFACTGVECSQFDSVEELKRSFEDCSVFDFDGLVVSKEFIEQNGLLVPSNFENFSPSHVWIPKNPYSGRGDQK